MREGEVACRGASEGVTEGQDRGGGADGQGGEVAVPSTAAEGAGGRNFAEGLQAWDHGDFVVFVFSG